MSAKKEFGKIEKWAEEGFARWLEKHAKTKTQIIEQVYAILDDHLINVVANLLGFDNSWGQWEVRDEHREPFSQARQFIEKHAKEGAYEWLKAQAGKLPTLPRQAVEELREEYLEMVRAQVNSLLREHAYKEAQRQYEKIIGMGLKKPDKDEE